MNTHNTRIHPLRALLAALLAALACGARATAADSMAETFEAKPSIPALAVGDKDLSTLVDALKAAHLVDTLGGKGPFTVFAPTNEAFAKLPAAALKSLLEPKNVGKLTSILTYHVVSGNVHAKDLRDGEMVTTLEGAKLRVSVRKNGVFIDGAKVTTADVDASNGVVHIIDQVLLPPAANFMAEIVEAKPSIPALAVGDKDLSTLVDALKAAHLVDTLGGKGPFTVFAPTNEAFAKLPAAALKSLLEPKNVGKLTSILTYHVVSGNVHAKDLRDGEMVTTLEGAKLRVSVRKNGVFIDGAKVTTADVDASNGVVHIIDQVLLPPAADSMAEIVEAESSTTFYWIAGTRCAQFALIEGYVPYAKRFYKEGDCASQGYSVADGSRRGARIGVFPYYLGAISSSTTVYYYQQANMLQTVLAAVFGQEQLDGPKLRVARA